MSQVEFHRYGLVLVPDPADKWPGVACILKNRPHQAEHSFCSCSAAKKHTCRHILKLADLYRLLHKTLGGKTPDEVFRSSVWYRLATILGDGCRETPQSVRLQFVTQNSGNILRVLDSNGKEMLCYLSQNAGLYRFVERFGQAPAENSVPHRGSLLDKLARMTRSKEERVMAERGFKSRRQSLEESFWYRLAYHAFRELGTKECVFEPGIEEGSGAFTVTCDLTGSGPVFRMTIPPRQVKRILATFKEFLPNQHGLAIHPIPLKSIFKVTADTKLDLEVRPVIRLLQESGEVEFFDREDLLRYHYGDLIYIPELKLLAELEPEGGKQRKLRAPVRMKLKESQVPTFLDEFANEFEEGRHIVDAAVKNLKIFREYDRVQMIPEAIDRDWCWLSMKYGFGNGSISLEEILRARQDGHRYVSIEGGWVDCQSADFEVLNEILDKVAEKEPITPSSQIKLSRLELFRLQQTSRVSAEVSGDGERAALLKRMLALKPARPLPVLKGLASSLRPYQKLGVEWLRFLFENGLGGLLCDDMGLGKTHQVMALMLALREKEEVKGPFLVACPTTVLSHWRNKILEHAPGLKSELFHGGQRDLKEILATGDVVITSYGILRNDIDQLENTPFALAVFDEIQYIKNPQTKAYAAAQNLKAEVKLGLTGTPIENSLVELKALFDLTVPGYLGPDKEFQARYTKSAELEPGGASRGELSRLVSPFALRRLKKSVLEELPEKIEDIRTCTLSEDQTKLYRDAIASRGLGLAEVLKKGEKPVPYMHIFALLTLLKQICNHPAMVDGRLDDYETYQSGKWDLFKELLSESLDSGQKVVVYSQFVAMIRIIEKFLHDSGVGFVTLTGASRKRGDIISRFNEDPNIRIYVGSLRAGGAGIDLIAASVVIHYDRWWNAAKEDQATDRVHRIGQKRGVQVFKLVTEGTLEEKISAIIEKKRELMESVVREDDPGLLKIFTREELISIMSAPH